MLTCHQLSSRFCQCVLILNFGQQHQTRCLTLLPHKLYLLLKYKYTSEVDKNSPKIQIFKCMLLKVSSYQKKFITFLVFCFNHLSLQQVHFLRTQSSGCIFLCAVGTFALGAILNCVIFFSSLLFTQSYFQPSW